MSSRGQKLVLRGETFFLMDKVQINIRVRNQIVHKWHIEGRLLIGGDVSAGL